MSSCEEAGEGEQRDQSSTCCIKVKPTGNLISSRSAFKVCEKSEGLSAKLGHYYPGVLLSLPSRGEKILTSAFFFFNIYLFIFGW